MHLSATATKHNRIAYEKRTFAENNDDRMATIDRWRENLLSLFFSDLHMACGVEGAMNGCR